MYIRAIRERLCCCNWLSGALKQARASPCVTLPVLELATLFICSKTHRLLALPPYRMGYNTQIKINRTRAPQRWYLHRLKQPCYDGPPASAAWPAFCYINDEVVLLHHMTLCWLEEGYSTPCWCGDAALEGKSCSQTVSNQQHQCSRELSLPCLFHTT